MKTRGLLAAATAALLAAGGLATVSTAANAAPQAMTDVSDASFIWGMSGQYQGGNPGNDTCNYFSAGEQLSYAAEQGNVRIVHDSGSRLELSSDATKCTGSTGNSYRQLMILSQGTGTADPATGEAEIAWDGTVIANAYGGLVPWSLSKLALHVGADGTGTLTATLGGYGSSMENPDVMIPLEKTPVTLATFGSVTVTEHGIEVLPDYAGVEIDVPEGVGAPQNRTVAGWGSWPQSVVDFHFASGLSSYWYTSGGVADHTKAATAFTVRFDGAPEVVDASTPPVITEQTKLHSTSAVIVSGRTVIVTAAAQNATSISWERSLTNRRLGEYAPIEGADSETLTFTADSVWDGKYVRMVASNASGTARSNAELVLTADYQEAVFTTQPAPVVGFAGYPVRFTADITAFPQTLTELNRVEMSTDEGKTWTEIEQSRGASNGLSAFIIPKLDAAHDGALIRAVASSAEGREAGSPGQTAATDPVRLTVLPAVGDGPQLAVLPNTPIDPETDTTVTVVGAGFTIPAWSESLPTVVSALDVALFDTEAWQPGTGGLERVAGVTYSANTWTDGNAFSEDFIRRQQGGFVLTATIPAGTLDAQRSYGFGSYLRAGDVVSGTNTWENRGGDAWAPVTLAGQEVTDFVPSEADLTDANRGGVIAPDTARAGTEITVKVGASYAGEDVQVFLFSAPVSIGTPVVAADGSVRVQLPANAADGAHKIAVYTAGDALIGWDDTVLGDAKTGGETGPGTSGTGSAGSGTGTAGGGLAATGGIGMAGLTVMSLGVLLLGAGAFAAARRTAARRAE